ncbi:MAG TPA: MarR family winged helix-turn-helix transcriptional regulator [Pseudonocardia sp.]|nr:MarR family winged helix-turn-helix transcriptional regulator [Pseudonocardia sp.]
MDNRSDTEIRADLSFLFDKAGQELTARMTTALAEVGLTPRSYCVLSKALPGDRTQGELAEIALLDKTTMVVTMDQLERAGLALRRPSSTDRRARIVQTTEQGRRVVERARTIIDGVYAEVLGVLPAAQRESLLDALVALVGRGGPLSAVGGPGPGPGAARRSRRASRTA